MDHTESPREQRRNRRAILREEWLAKQEEAKERKAQRKQAAEVRGNWWLAHRSGANADIMLAVSMEILRAKNLGYPRRPLGRWAKGKVWSENAEMYV